MKQKVVLVTGLSGAGKTSAMGVLEDMGYHCMDRFPAELIDHLISLHNDSLNGHFKHLALTVNSVDFHKFYERFKHHTEVELMVLFLDANRDELLLRYKFSRRQHPLIIAGLATSLEEAIDAEIKEFSEVKQYATLIIDTSYISPHDLRTRIRRFFTFEEKDDLTISFISFGYRKGIARDADLVFDVRFLRNPYWEEKLRSKTGNSLEVYSYVIENDETKKYLASLINFLDNQIALYIKQSRHHITIAIGCTGGQHRSVSVVNYLYEYYRKTYSVYKNHRDVGDVTDVG